MTETELNRLKKDELLTLAKQKKIKVAASLTKADLVKLIFKSEAPAAAPQSKKAAPSKAAPAKKTEAKTKTVEVKKAPVKKAAKVSAKPPVKAAGASKKAASPAKTTRKTPARPMLDDMNDTLKGESKKFEIEDWRGYFEPMYDLSGDVVYSLPHDYGDTRLTLLVQDPYFIHAYWELSPSVRRHFGIENSGHGQDVIIRVYHADTDDFFDVHVNDNARSWYFNVPHPNRPYFAEIGLMEPNGLFRPIVRSNMIEVPSDRASSLTDALNAENRVADELFRQSGGYVLHKQVGSEVVSEWLASGSGISSFGSNHVTSGSGVPEKPRKRSFWAELHTELIVYGSTEPDAQASLGGVPIKLSPDGKFSIRFYLKDGDHSIPFVATSKDGVDTIEIVPFVTQRTTREERTNP